MHPANHYYGHLYIMARYAGFADEHPPALPGYLQHGWNVIDGFAVGMRPDIPGWPRFVWSETVRRRAWAAGRRDVTVIGAAWNYLLQLKPRLGVVPEDQRTGTIWYPFHGWEGQEVVGDHRKLARDMAETEPGPVTVCLYWNEHRNPEIRAEYEAHGFRVITHGYRGKFWQDTDKDFLLRQLIELRRHRYVATNRLSTAVFYGTAVGCTPRVYGDPMQLEREHPSFGGPARIRRLWPELHGVNVDLAAARETVARELGVDYLVSPVELRNLFRWQAEFDRRSA